MIRPRPKRRNPFKRTPRQTSANATPHNRNISPRRRHPQIPAFTPSSPSRSPSLSSPSAPASTPPFPAAIPAGGRHRPAVHLPAGSPWRRGTAGAAACAGPAAWLRRRDSKSRVRIDFHPPHRRRESLPRPHFFQHVGGHADGGHRLARLLRAGASGVSACGALHAANSPTNTNAPTVLVAMRFPLLVMQDTTPNLRRRGCDGCRAPAVRSYGGRCKPCADFSAVCGSIRARGTDCTLLSAHRGRYASRLRRASSGRLLALF